MKITINNRCPHVSVMTQDCGDEQIITIRPCLEEWERRRLKPLPEMNQNSPASTMKESGGDDGKRNG